MFTDNRKGSILNVENHFHPKYLLSDIEYELQSLQICSPCYRETNYY